MPIENLLDEARRRPGFIERLRRRMEEDKTILDRLAASDDQKIRPLLVQFYRCGRIHQGRGWVKCRTPETCYEKGCQQVSAVPLKTFRDGCWHSAFCSAVGNPCPIDCLGRTGDEA